MPNGPAEKTETSALYSQFRVFEEFFAALFTFACLLFCCSVYQVYKQKAGFIVEERLELPF